jgi:hypothetical protein
MTYTQTALDILRSKGGSLLKKIYYEFGLVKTELDALLTANGKAAINTEDLTASMVSSTNLAANGVDIASGSNATFYAVWCAPVACTIVSMDTFLTEAYIKETTDAKIEIVDNAASPVTKCTYTLPVGGRAVKTMVSTTPTSAALAAGDILNLAITATASSTGTGHAKVFLRYTIN